MVERFYHQLKAALKAQNNPSSWMDALPLMLLGIQTALKEDISSTAAEMVHKLLQPPYNGPYPVIRRTNKYFTVDITSHKDTVSIDHLKPAHLDVVNDIFHLKCWRRICTLSSYLLWATSLLPKHLSQYVS